MSKRRKTTGSGAMLELWRPPQGAGEPVGCLATTFTFSPALFEEQCLARFLEIESEPNREDLAFLLEREKRLGSAYAAVLADYTQALLASQNALARLSIQLRTHKRYPADAIHDEAQALGATLRGALERLVDQTAPRLAVQRDPEILEMLVRGGVLAQVAASSFDGAFGGTVQRFALELVGRGLVHVVSSDAHDTERRLPGLREPLERAGLGEFAEPGALLLVGDLLGDAGASAAVASEDNEAAGEGDAARCPGALELDRALDHLDEYLLALVDHLVDGREAIHLVPHLVAAGLFLNGVGHVKEHALGEGVSTRLLVYAGKLMAQGVPARRACQVAITWALTDDQEVQRSMEEVVTSIFE